MLGITHAEPGDDQPIGGPHGATLFHEPRYLSSWVMPNSLGIQDAYKQLTNELSDRSARIKACWEYVKNIPYVQFVRTHTNVGGKIFSQGDAWLDPAQSLQVGRLNCLNKSTLLASLLRQDLSAEEIYVCLCNLTSDGVGGHAICYLASNDLVMETTNPELTNPFMRARDADIYESVIFFNDQNMRYVPGVPYLSEPLGNCCVGWLRDYVNDRLCTEYV